MKTSLRIVAAAAALFAAFVPFTTHAQATDGPISECLELAGGDKAAFIECVNNLRQSLQEEFVLPEGWFERLSNFVEDHPDWAARIRGIADRLEDYWDQHEDRRDSREDRLDRRENRYVHRENFRDRFEGRRDGLWPRQPCFFKKHNRFSRF